MSKARKRPWPGLGTLFLLAVLPALAAILHGCGYLEKQKIESALKDKNQALAQGRVKPYLSFFSPAYQDEWKGFSALAKKAGERLEKKPLPAFSFRVPKIFIRGNKAVAVERFTLEDKVKGRSKRWDETQHLVLEKEGGKWRCVRGSEVLRLLGGRMEEEYEIEQVLLRREAALVNQDLELYESLISPRYLHRGERKQDLLRKIRQNFLVYDELSFRSYDRKIWFFGDHATVQQRFTMQATQLGKPMTFTGEERFELEKTKDGWKFIKGL